ncbi:MAG: alpha/beta hydrolase [Saprospirales bacterium]|nr:MAG: alpha/beta hydrolase [Saprospirales bacterium]
MYFKDFFYQRKKAGDPLKKILTPYHPAADFLQLPEIGSIAYVDTGGSDSPVVFVHGLGTYLPSWYPVLRHLGRHYRCIALDLPNYGMSDKGHFSFSMDFFTTALELFLDEMKLNRVVLAGHSMGGQIAIELALKRPDLMEGLILLAPAGFETFSEQEKIWIKTFSQPEHFLALNEVQVKQNFYNNFFRRVEAAEFMLKDRLSIMNTSYYPLYCQMISKCFSAMVDKPVFHQLRELSVPTQILFGRQDAMIPNPFLHPTSNPAVVARKGASEIKDSKLFVLDEAGHMLMWDQPEKVNHSIKSFLDSTK